MQPFVFKYSYFTFQSLGFYIPKPVKRALTSIQIVQFIAGLGIASFYLFVSYKAPIKAMEGAFANGNSPLSVSVGGPDQFPSNTSGYTTVRCLADGEGFPLIVGSIYLLPLIYLFVQFYNRAYAMSGAKVKKA